MNAVIEKQNAKFLPKKAAPAPAKNDLGASLSVLQGLLDSAWQSSCDPEQGSCDGTRLLATATSMVEGLQADHSSPVKVECALYDVAAQVKAALLVPGDTPSAERVALVGQIGVVLGGLLDDPLVLKNWGPAPSSTPAFAFEEIDFPEVIPNVHARVIEALSVLEMAAEHHGDHAVWGLHHLTDWLDAQCEMHESDRTPWTDGQFSKLLADVATTVAVLDEINNRLDCQLLHAARTILNVAMESLNAADAASSAKRKAEQETPQ
ncbi:hypothetical protein G7048_03915 [Diaphorobacter sp. HDW4B]|uniref:hypothetical protein n=1 Tax=Diaphorobacter sp. HDW4B TaxID=2714925 RepID=UPI00140D9D09|nr:hypothetical protein [Diaphorobacter sp. HDW4B]QIL69592.1 hypothetical protein G7048_03915 [Diaphorobacter sp. HDW4B]